MTTGLDIAKEYFGCDEVADRLELMKFFKANKINCDPKTTPWCAAFVNACERAVGNKGTGLLTARSFLKYGKSVELKDAVVGDICIFERGNSSWQGHVAYYIGHSADLIRILGGNQSDCVCYTDEPVRKLLGIRRP